MYISPCAPENRLFLNQPEADVFWEGMVRIAKQETQGLDNSHMNTYTGHLHIQKVCGHGNGLECVPQRQGQC